MMGSWRLFGALSWAASLTDFIAVAEINARNSILPMDFIRPADPEGRSPSRR
jgi:hypothetical protein